MQLTVTRRLIKQKARRQPFRDRPRHRPPTACRLTVSDLFHSPLGVLFTFPSRYLSTIGHSLVFSLGEWSPRIPARFLVSGRTWDTARLPLDFAYTTITFYGGPFQTLPLSSSIPHCSPATPSAPKPRWFRLFPFRSPLLWESLLISFPLDTEMFHFSRYCLKHLWIQCFMARYDPDRVSPFGHPRI
jgi:hypothetical protein